MNGNAIMTTIAEIGFMILGIAALAIILSPKATTGNTIQAVASGFSNALGTAMSPVTGADVQINTSYAASDNTPSFHTNMPHFN